MRLLSSHQLITSIILYSLACIVPAPAAAGIAAGSSRLANLIRDHPFLTVGEIPTTADQASQSESSIALRGTGSSRSGDFRVPVVIHRTAGLQWHVLQDGTPQMPVALIRRLLVNIKADIQSKASPSIVIPLPYILGYTGTVGWESLRFVFEAPALSSFPKQDVLQEMDNLMQLLPLRGRTHLFRGNVYDAEFGQDAGQVGIFSMVTNWNSGWR